MTIINIIIILDIIYLTSRSIHGSKDFIVQLPESSPAKLKMGQNVFVHD